VVKGLIKLELALYTCGSSLHVLNSEDPENLIASYPGSFPWKEEPGYKAKKPKRTSHAV